MLLFLIILISGIVIDIYTKYLAVAIFKVNEIEVIKNILYFTYVENRGAAFGILQNQKWLLVVFTLIIMIFIIIYLIIKKPDNKILISSLSLILSGGIGNLIDRINYSYVIDFIDVRIINYPVFNIADCLVVCGSILLCVYILFFYEK